MKSSPAHGRRLASPVGVSRTPRHDRPGSTFPVNVSEQAFRLPNKYKAKATYVDGIRFDSMAEAGRWRELQLLERTGQIKNLQRQVPLSFYVDDKTIFKLVVDFAYSEGEQHVYEDKKGHPTPLFKLKRRLIEAQHKITMRIT